jgi:hypothetical protein
LRRARGTNGPYFPTQLRSASSLLIGVLPFLALPGVARGQEGATQEKPDAAVRTQMHNVKYRLSDSVAVQINSLNGALVPTSGNEFPVLDDKNSFRIHIDTAEIAIGPTDLANLLNSHVFARPNSPLSGISVAIVNGRLQVKGKLRDRGDIPFETQAVMTPTPDGRIRLHSEKIKALHVPVKGLMDAFGIGVDDMIKSGKVPGVQAEENDLILDLEQMLPPPHIDGKVTSVRVERNSIIQTFGGAGTAPAPKLRNANYMAFRGNRLRCGKLTMDDADVVLYDLNPDDPMDFYLDHYKDQLAAGYAKITTSFQLHVFLKDFDKLGQTRSTAKSKVN